MTSSTPRTDATLASLHDEHLAYRHHSVTKLARFARTLERELQAEKAAQEAFAIRVLGQETYDNSPCQAHPLELVEAALSAKAREGETLAALLDVTIEYLEDIGAENPAQSLRSARKRILEWSHR